MATKAKDSPPKKAIKDPKGGLTAAGRAHFKETEGADLKPGVKGPADTPEKQKRKGSFLRRHFANPDAGPLTDEKGKPTRHALSAAAWGEPVPKTEADAKKLAKKGSDLLEQYHESGSGGKKPAPKKASPKANGGAAKTAGKSAASKPAATRKPAASKAKTTKAKQQ